MAEKADYCHNKTSFIVLKNSSKGKSFQWRRATKGTTDQLLYGGVSCWMSRYACGLGLRWRAWLLVRAWEKQDWRQMWRKVMWLHLKNWLYLFRWPRKLYCRGDTQQSGWQHDCSLLAHPISCTLVPWKGRVILTDAWYINPATWDFWHGLSWLPIKFKSRVSLVCVVYSELICLWSLKICLALQT